MPWQIQIKMLIKISEENLLESHQHTPNTCTHATHPLPALTFSTFVYWMTTFKFMWFYGFRWPDWRLTLNTTPSSIIHCYPLYQLICSILSFALCQCEIEHYNSPNYGYCIFVNAFSVATESYWPHHMLINLTIRL